ncbi:hypothetical protein F4778DRAFT_107726 [Xylariomycetidae sp. FL2044]|nr:hypothetical protein F4778DRAFT_107726 [Xylariomycetidae sp. FL2044]
MSQTPYLADQGWVSVDVPERFYEQVHTRGRPPYLNQTNFPSVQTSGSSSHPTLLMRYPTEIELDDAEVGEGAHSLGSYTPSVPASDTESTATGTIILGGGGTDPVPRIDIPFFLERDYDGTVLPLTEHAVAAHNHAYNMDVFPGDIRGWINGHGRFFGDETPSPSASIVMPKQPRSDATRTTRSSWSVVSSVQRHLGRIGENIYGAGSKFDTPVDPAMASAPAICDEDVV